MARGRIARSRRYAPTAPSLPRRSWKTRSRGGTGGSGKAFWSVSRKPRFYKFTRYCPVAVVASQSTNATTAPTFLGTNWVVGGTWTADRGVTTIQQGGAALQFMLSDVTGYTEFTTLFDNYRVTGVELEFVYNSTSTYADPGGAPIASQPMVYYCIDTDDSTAPTNPSALLERDGTKTLALGDGKAHKVRIPFPRVANAVYNGALFTGYGQGRPGQWIDCVNPGIPHYGIKFWFEGMPVTTNPGACAITIRRKFFLETKEVI